MIFLRIAVLGFLSLWLIYMYLLTLPAAERQKSVPFYQSDSFNVIAHGNGARCYLATPWRLVLMPCRSGLISWKWIFI